MSDRLKELQVELQRVLLILNSFTQWEELGNKLDLIPAELDQVRAFLEQESGEPRLADLVFELKNVDWRRLGVQLNISYDILETINKEHSDESRKLHELLQTWQKKHTEHSWEKIIEALHRIGGYAKIIASIQSRTSPLACMLSMWIQNKPNASWEMLCIALKQLGSDTMADKIQQHFGCVAPSLRDLVLLKISAWFNLGLRLRIEEHILKLISNDHQNDTGACCRAMFSRWLGQSVDASYQELIEALCDVEEYEAAKQIHYKFGIECSQLQQKLRVPVPSVLHFSGTQMSSIFQRYAELLCAHYCQHQLFHPDQWPPRLSRIFINLALVLHDKRPLSHQMGDFEKTTLHGTVDDLCFKKYSIELDQIFKTDKFFLQKTSELKKERKTYENQLVRLLNSPMPDFLKKHLSIPMDDGEGLPSKEEVKGVLKQPQFLQRPQLRTLLCPKEGASKPNVSEAKDVSPPDNLDDIILKVLIDGAPGVGKTTLTWKISKEWAEGKLFAEHKLVVRISLRDLPDDPQSLWELLPLGSDQLRMKVEAELLDCNGKGALFILDGWDELSETQRKRGSILYKLIRGDVLSQCAIIITSRPYTSKWLQLPDMVPRHIELFGFTQSQIRSCIHSEFTSTESLATAQKLIRLLEVRTDIFKLCYIPNNLSIIIHIFSTSNNRLPTTLTKLYELYIHSTIVRYLQNQCDDLEVPLGYDDETPFPLEIKELYGSLCKLALRGLKESRMVFRDKQMQDLNPELVKEGNTLGLMTAYKSFTVYGVQRSFQFIHATVQEFLAAEALARQDQEEQLKFTLEHIDHPRFRMVLFFLAGRTDLHHLQNLFYTPVSFAGHMNVKRLLLLVRMLFEAQNSKLCSMLAQSFPENSFQFSKFVSYDMPVISELDQYMLCYFLQHSSHAWKTVDAHEASLLQILEAFKTSAAPKASFKEVHICSATQDEVYKMLCDPTFHNVIAIRAAFEKPPGEHACHLLSSHTLTHLHFDCYSQETLEATMTVATTCKNLQYLGLKSVSKDHMSTHKLLLSASVQFPTIRGEQFRFKCQKLKLSDQFTEVLCQEIAKSQCFEQLSLSDCTLNAYQLRLLYSAVRSNSTLKVVHLRPLPAISLSSDAAIALKDMVETNTTTKTLQLCRCSLGRDEAIILGQALEVNQHLISLDLSNNRFSGSINVILQGLQTPTVATSFHMQDLNPVMRIQELVLKECDLDDEAMTSVAQFISSEHCTLKRLDLSSNHIKEKGCGILFTALTTNASLEVLILNSNPMWMSGGDQIESMLKQNHTLCELHLMSSLHVDVVRGIASGIEQNETLRTLKLGYSLRTTPLTAACVIFKALKVNNSLQHLHLSAYDLGNEGTETAAVALKHNSFIQSLCFKRCKFGSSESIETFVKSLYSHKSLAAIAVPTTGGVLNTIFAQYNQINHHRASNRLPYIRVKDSFEKFTIDFEDDLIDD